MTEVRKSPVMKEVKFRLSRCIAMTKDVMPHIFHSILQKFALVQPKRYPVFFKYFTYTSK